MISPSEKPGPSAARPATRGLSEVNAPSARKSSRLLSLDAYRGFIMVILASSGLGAVQLAKQFPDTLWADIGRQFSHTPWIGCTLWDLIMPAFMLMVGVSMPLSYARRRAQGDSFGTQFRHAAIRALVLIALGWWLQNQQSLFLNVLTQIGLGYLFVFLLLDRSVRVQLMALVGVLMGYGLLYALYPVPGEGFNFAARGATAQNLLPGFWAHWSKNLNVGTQFDIWLLNHFPQDKPFVTHVGSTVTLNFISSMANMILGVMSGQRLVRESTPQSKFRWLVGVGALCMTVALVVGLTLCPIVKRIWTPSFALFSGAWTLWMLAAFYWLIEIRGWRRWAFPLAVVGMNSIAIYIMTLLWPAWIQKTLTTHLGAHLFEGTYEPVWTRASILVILWLCCWWLNRRKIFFKI